MNIKSLIPEIFYRLLDFVCAKYDSNSEKGHLNIYKI